MKMTKDQNDALAEVINIGVGRAAASMAELVNDKIDLSVPSIIVCDLNDLGTHLGDPSEPLDTSVIQDFTGGLSGRSVLAFPQSSGIKLGHVFAGYDDAPDRLDLDLSDILEEIGNIVLNGVLGSISNLLDTSLIYSVPQLHTNEKVEELINQGMEEREHSTRTVLIANAQFNIVSRNIQGTLLILFDVGGVQTVLDALLNEEVLR